MTGLPLNFGDQMRSLRAAYIEENKDEARNWIASYKDAIQSAAAIGSNSADINTARQMPEWENPRFFDPQSPAIGATFRKQVCEAAREIGLRVSWGEGRRPIVTIWIEDWPSELD